MATRIAVMTEPRAPAVPGGMTEVAILAYPAVLNTLSDTLMQVVDAAIVGRLGVTELGAVGFGGIWMWTMMVPFVGTASGVQTFVAQAFGAGSSPRCGQWVWHGIYALVPAAFLWTFILALGFGTWMGALGSSPELHARAVDYAQGRMLGVPAVVAGVALASCFRGLGDTRTPLLASVAANLVNAALAYGLVFGKFGLPAWGVFGAGIGIAAGNWVYTAIMLTALLRPRMVQRYGTWPVAPDIAAMRRLVRTSAPIGGQWFLDMTSFAFFSTFIARMGDTSMAASQAMLQLLALSFMQAVGISIAAGALVGRYVGAGDHAAAARSHRSALGLGLLLAAAVALLFVAVPGRLLSIFTDEPDVLSLGRPLMLLAALFQIIDAIGIIAGGSLRGAGDTRWPFLVQAALAWGLRLPLVALLTMGLQAGVIGAWLGELGYVSVLAVVYVWRFQSGAWRQIRI